MKYDMIDLVFRLWYLGFSFGLAILEFFYKMFFSYTECFASLKKVFK